jgi:hypothetical protein
MPLVVLPIALVVGLAMVAFLPFSLVLRYRAGTARRRARGWVATLNVAGFALTVPLFVAASALTNLWAPGTLANTALGLAAGAALGVLGLIGSRWESSRDGLHYRPNRLIVLVVLVVVAGRLAYGAWSAWARWQANPGDASWLAFGAAGSLVAGGIVLGYYAAYWVGVRLMLSRHALRHSQRGR